VSDPKLTKRMKMHLNGSGFSILSYDVLADGKPTGITHHRKTNGRPEYLITEDVWQFKDEVFDAIAAKGLGLIDWIKARVAESASANGSEQGIADSPVTP
jgi:hypothetical protein